jgi:hypothetical protein
VLREFVLLPSVASSCSWAAGKYAMSDHYQAIVRIDRQAKLIELNATDVDHTTLRGCHPDQHIHHKANAGDSGHAPADNEFLKRVTETIAHAGASRITGKCDDRTGSLHQASAAAACRARVRGSGPRSSKRRCARRTRTIFLQSRRPPAFAGAAVKRQPRPGAGTGNEPPLAHPRLRR